MKGRVLILVVKNNLAVKNIIFELNVTMLGIQKCLNVFPCSQYREDSVIEG